MFHILSSGSVAGGGCGLRKRSTESWGRKESQKSKPRRTRKRSARYYTAARGKDRCELKNRPKPKGEVCPERGKVREVSCRRVGEGGSKKPLILF